MSIMEQRYGLEAMPDDALVGEGVHFERIRRITGYLVGTLERFNDGKRAEERDRVKHMKIEWVERHKA